MPGIESFGTTPFSDPTNPEIDNARQMPVIDSGVASIKLGLFTRLSRDLHRREPPARAVPLAYCTVQTAFCDPITQPTMAAFAADNVERIESEIRKLFANEKTAEQILLAYAALMISLGWQTRNPFNEISSQLTERATDNDQLIPNIVQMWGADAIVTFFQTAHEFMISTLNG